MKKSAHSVSMHPATHRENDFPTYAGEVKPEMAHDGIAARVRPTTARVHEPLPLIEKIEKMPHRGVKPKKRHAAGRE